VGRAGGGGGATVDTISRDAALPGLGRCAKSASGRAMHGGLGSDATCSVRLTAVIYTEKLDPIKRIVGEILFPGCHVSATQYRIPRRTHSTKQLRLHGRFAASPRPLGYADKGERKGF